MPDLPQVRTVENWPLPLLQEKQDEWFMQEAEENAKLREMFQAALDAPRLRAIKARVEKAGREIKRDAALLERNELLRRNVVRGRRK